MNGQNGIVDAGPCTLFELNLQRVRARDRRVLLGLVNWTYWLSQFAVVGLALLWIYFFRNEAFP